MKKLFTALFVIILGYLFAYFFVGKAKNYPLIPSKKQISNFDLFKNISFFKISPERMKLADSMFVKGKKQYLQKNYTSAIDYFSKAFKLNKKLYEAIYWKAKSEYKNENYDDAIADFENLKDKTDRFDSSYLYLGKCYYYNSDYYSAVENLEDFVEKYPESADAYDWLAWAYYRDYEDPEEGMEYEKLAIKADSSYSEAWFGLAYFYIDIADSTFNPDSSELFYKKAISANRICLKYDKNKYAAYNNYYSYKRIGNIDSALYFAKLAAKFDTAYFNAYNALSYAYLKKKEYSKSLRSSLRAIELDSTNSTSHYYCAESYFHLKQYKEAEKEYFKAYKNGKDVEYILNAEKCAELDNDNDARIYYLSEYLDASPYDDPKRDSILEVLKKLQK